MANLTEFNCAKAAGCASRRTDANAAGLGRRQRIARHAILVAGDEAAFQRLVRILARNAIGAQVDQGEVGVGAARDHGQAALLQGGISPNFVAMGYQFGYLILPPVVPIVLWIGLNSEFLQELVEFTREPPEPPAV